MLRRRVCAVLVVGLGLAPCPAAAIDARRAVEEFVGRLAEVRISDLTVRQTLVLYHPDGRHPQSTGEQQLFIKLPRRQRLEQTIEGQREVRLAVEDRIWVRRADGVTAEAASGERARTSLLTPLRRSAADLLAEWKALGVRVDVAHQGRFRGRTVTVIGAGPKSRDAPAIWLDPDYGAVRVIMRERLPGGDTVLDLTMSEHRSLAEGFFYPHRQELFAGGRLLFVITVQSVAINTDLPDGLFDPDALRRER